MRYTPGPWKVNIPKCGGNVTIQAAEQILPDQKYCPNGWPVASLNSPSTELVSHNFGEGKKYARTEYGQKVYEQSIANANLIAAAPEMFEAIKEFISSNDDKNSQYWYNTFNDLLKKDRVHNE